MLESISTMNFSIFNYISIFLCFFSVLKPRDPTIQNLQAEIYISTKRRQNPMEFRWFREHSSIFQKRRVGPTLITRFSVCIFIHLHTHIHTYIYIYLYTHTKPRNKSRAYAAFLQNRRMLTKPLKFHRILTPFGRNVDLDL